MLSCACRWQGNRSAFREDTGVQCDLALLGSAAKTGPLQAQWGGYLAPCSQMDTPQHTGRLHEAQASGTMCRVHAHAADIRMHTADAACVRGAHLMGMYDRRALSHAGRLTHYWQCACISAVNLRIAGHSTSVPPRHPR